MRVTLDNLNALRKADPTLYAYILPATRGFGDVFEIDLAQIKGEAHRKLLEAWARENDVEEPLSSSHGTYCSCDSCFQDHAAERARNEAARLEVEKQNAPGQARLNEYMTRLSDQGQVLLNNDFNKDVFWKFLDEKFPGLTVISPRHVDVFIQAKRLELQWARPQSIPAPVPTPQPESVLLSDGNSQKGLDESPSRSWSVEQLKDYDRRKRLQASGESESLPPLEYIRSGKIVSEPRLPLGTKIGPQHSVEQIRDLNVRTANAHARQTGSHGASWFSDSRGL